MLRFKVTVDKYEYDPAVSEQLVYNWLQKELRAAALAFFKAALPNIHVWTGMSVASFTNLARFLGVPLAPLRNPIMRKPGKRWRYAPTGQMRSPALGETMGTDVDEIITKSPISGKPMFQYWTKVWQFIFFDTEFSLLNDGSPWQAFEIGQNAAIAHMASAITRFPDVKLLLSKSEVRVLVQPGLVKREARTVKRRQSTARNK